MKATVNIKSANLQATTQALIDSGATDNFISPVLSNRHKLSMYKLDKSRVVRNVDGTPNLIGKVTYATDLTINYNDIRAELCFLIIDLGGDDMILGYPFLELTNPIINWSTGEFPGEVTVQTKDAYKWTPERQLNYLDKMNIDNFISSKEEGYDHDPNFIPNNERGIIKNPNYFTRRVTMATELAIGDYQRCNQLNEWKSKVPKEYHQFGSVFSKEEAQRFPKSKPYDHAIDLHSDAPATLDCKVYPLAPMEQGVLEDFIKEHLKKKYIRQSNLHMHPLSFS